MVTPSDGLGEVIRDTLQSAVSVRATLVLSADEARAVAREEDFDLAVLDFSDHARDAAQLALHLREGQPTLAMIGLPREDAQRACRGAGLELEGYLPLPFYFPNLAQIVAEVLDLSLEADELQTGRLLSKSQHARTSRTATAWLESPETARSHLNRLLGETSAHAVVLSFAEGTDLSSGRLSEAQIDNLRKLIDEHLTSRAVRGTLARYMDLPDRSGGCLLFSTVPSEDMVLSLVFDAKTPFGKARREASQLAQNLLRVDPTLAASPESKQDPSHLQDPSASLSPNALKSFEETILDGQGLPPPAPSPDRVVAPAGRDASESSPAAPTIAEGKRQASSTYTIALAPRSAEHRLTGALAQAVSEAVSSVCLSSTWPLRDLSLDERYLLLTLELPTSRSPTSAVQELRRASSQAILERHSQLSLPGPSRQFWSPRYLLQPGNEIRRSKLDTLIREAHT